MPVEPDRRPGFAKLLRELIQCGDVGLGKKPGWMDGFYLCLKGVILDRAQALQQEFRPAALSVQEQTGASPRDCARTR